MLPVLKIEGDVAVRTNARHVVSSVSALERGVDKLSMSASYWGNDVDDLSKRFYTGSSLTRGRSAVPVCAVRLGTVSAAAAHERTAILDALRPVVHGLVRTLGQGCEVVLHDFADPEHSIIEIAGNVTDRLVGGSVTQIGLALIAAGDQASDKIGYITRTPTNRIVKASTLLIKDRRAHVIGALCINLDVTELRAAAKKLAELSGPPTVAPAEVDFTDDITHVLQGLVSQAEREVGRRLDQASKSDRVAIVAALKRRGAFAVQRAVPFVADYLGVSRATVYAYLESIRECESAEMANNSHSK
jgi:predicted transcriptional regulator YheO